MIHTCVKRKKWSSTGTLLSPCSVDSGRIVNHPHLCKRKEWVTHWDSCCLHAVDWGMIVAFIHSCGLGGEWCHHNWKRDHHYHVACPSQHFTLSMSLSTHHFQYVTLSTSLSICHSQHATLNTAPPTRHPQHVTLSMSLKVPNHEDPQRADHTQLSCPTITDAKSIWLNKIEFSFLFVGKWMDRPTICPVPVKTLAFLYFTELHQVRTTEVKLTCSVSAVSLWELQMHYHDFQWWAKLVQHGNLCKCLKQKTKKNMGIVQFIDCVFVDNW